MKAAVRLDDITPDMDWELFLDFKALLDRYQVKPLIGVVPCNRDENLKTNGSRIPVDFWSYIKQLEQDGWMIAMHGCYHIYTTDRGGLFPLNDFSEFAGLPFEEQKKLLREGKRLLEEKGIKTDLFMAPAHSYDKYTLKALRETGFKALTDGFGWAPYHWKGLDFYPISFKLSKTLKKKKGYSSMVIHTDTVSREDLKRYEGYFQTADTQWISFREYVRQPKKRRTTVGRWNEYCMAKGKYLIGKIRNRKRWQV